MRRSIFVTAKNSSQLQMGKWYFGAVCKACGKRLVIFEDTERGGRPFDVGDVMLAASCPYCGADGHLYRSDEVRSFQHLPNA